MKRLFTVVLCLTLLTGCESLKIRNMGKSGVTTGIAYAVGGTIPAVGVLATSMAYDEIIPAEQSIDDIKTSEQAVAYVATGLATDALYAFIAFLLITNVVVPWITRRNGYAKAKKKYKDVEFKSDMKL